MPAPHAAWFSFTYVDDVEEKVDDERTAIPPPQDVEASFELAAAQSTESCEAASSSSPPPTVTARLSRSTRREKVETDPVASATPAPAPARLLEATASPLASNLASALAASPPPVAFAELPASRTAPATKKCDPVSSTTPPPSDSNAALCST